MIAIATAVPAIAASTPAAGSTVTLSGSTWTATSAAVANLTQSDATGLLPVNGAAGHAKGYYLTGSPVENSFTSGSDTDGDRTVISAVYTFNVTAGATYSLALSVLVQYGSYQVNRWTAASNAYSERQSLDVTVSNATVVGLPLLPRVTLKHANLNTVTNSDSAMTGYTIQQPSDGTKAYKSTIKASSTGTMMVTYTFTLDKRASANFVNDDIWVSAPTLTYLSS